MQSTICVRSRSRWRFIEDDCDNEDPNLGVKRTFYADTDGDGFEIQTRSLKPVFFQKAPLRMRWIVMTPVPMSISKVEDVFYDGVDADCDGSNDCDQDGDGFDGSAEGGVPTEECPNATDCNDEDPEVRPVAATEVQFNGEDDDCNVNTGDGDFDGDGFGMPIRSHRTCQWFDTDADSRRERWRLL